MSIFPLVEIGSWLLPLYLELKIWQSSQMRASHLPFDFHSVEIGAVSKNNWSSSLAFVRNLDCFSSNESKSSFCFFFNIISASSSVFLSAVHTLNSFSYLIFIKSGIRILFVSEPKQNFNTDYRTNILKLW